jgi:hypothetical protein
MRQVIEQQAHASGRTQILVHDEPHAELDAQCARQQRRESVAASERDLAEADAQPGAQRCVLPEVAVAPKREQFAIEWFLTRLLAPFVETFREMQEMRYLWAVPLELDNRKLVAFLGKEPHTPLETALGETLRGLGCLPAAPSLRSAALTSVGGCR